MSVYENPTEYARITRMTLEDATFRCEHFLKIKKEIHKAIKCPKCGEHSLNYDAGEWESGVSAFVYCEECDFTDHVKPEYKFYGYDDFDDVLYFGLQLENGTTEENLYLGYPWNEFIRSRMEEIRT